MSFNESTINRFFGLNDDDSKEFKALYREPNYDNILEELTDGSAPWARNSTQEVMFFPGTGLTEIAKTRFTLYPPKHLSTVGRDKALLTYAIVKGYNFNVGKMIENSILELVYHKAIAHQPM